MYRILALLATSSVHPALYAVPVRTVGISPRTSFPTVCYRPAVVLQVWDSASSRLRADFHRSAHIASFVQQTAALLRVRQEMRRFSFAVGRYQALRRRRAARPARVIRLRSASYAVTGQTKRAWHAEATPRPLSAQIMPCDDGGSPAS